MSELKIVDLQGQVPYINDDTRRWAEKFREGDLLTPQLHLRVATDTNYIRDRRIVLPAYGTAARAQAVMNLVLPGTRIPSILSWGINETMENEVATASCEVLNALPVSEIETTTTTSLSADLHSTTIKESYVQNSLFVTEKVVGNVNIETVNDSQGFKFRERNLQARQFDYQSFTLTDGSLFPDPAIPNDDDNDLATDSFYPSAGNGVGSYFVLIDEEIVRVVKKTGGNTLYVPPGGRGIASQISAHSIGATVKLLGYGPYTGEIVGAGYLSVDDYRPMRALLRAGTCLTSYEGYGKIAAPLSHDYDAGSNYTFTGYWFVKQVEDSFDADGLPKASLQLVGPGALLNDQQITIDIVQRIKNQFGKWRTPEGGDLFKTTGHGRDIPGDWVDFNSWDPTLRNSYPLKIKTEIAQHKEFFEHMRETQNGLKCAQCRAELKAWENKHGKSDGGNSIAAQRKVGRHIYKESIRVLDTESGPIKTYIRLMLTIAMAAWDHPPQGVDLAQRFTKFPAKLFDNMRNIHSGLVYNGQIDFKLAKHGRLTDWSKPIYDDADIISKRREVTCPFETTYDKAPFAQPVKDLAETNDNIFWINRRGFPVFLPRNFPLRPSGTGYKKLNNKAKPIRTGGNIYTECDGEWTLAHGGSITTYSHSVDPSAVLTQAWVTAKSAFESTFTSASAGTGYRKDGSRVVHGPVAGNKEGLAFTGGVQKLDTISMENQILGLEWNINPAGWGVQGTTNNGVKNFEKKPQLYDGVPNIGPGKQNRPSPTKTVQKTVNFFLLRRYVEPIHHKDKWWYQIPVDGKYGDITEKAVEDLETYLKNNVTGSGIGTPNKTYTRDTYVALKKFFEQNKHYLKFDIWWYVQNGRDWLEYVAAITGVHVALKKNPEFSTQPRNTNPNAVELPKWIIDDKGMQKEVEKWQKQYIQQAVNVGNRRVDDSINKAVTRSIQCSIADPRIQPGDIIWMDVPGFQSTKDETGAVKPPFGNGVYLVSVTRQMDLQAGSYTATYSGYRYQGLFGRGAKRAVNKGYDFIN